MLYPLSQALSFFYSVTAEPLVRRIFTPDNARRTLYVLVTAFFSTLLYASAFLLYTIIYYHFIPESAVSVPLYFDYSWLAVDPYHAATPLVVQDALGTARGVATGSAGSVSEDKTAQIPGPFAAIDLSATLLPLMRHSVSYQLAVDLDLPRNTHNKNLGNFMVRLAMTPNIHEFVRLHGPASPLSRGASSPSPAYVVPNKQLLYQKAGLVSRFPLTHFPETYLMDLPKLYVRGPAVHPARGGTPNSTTTLYAGVPLHAVAPSKQQQKPLVSVLATRPAILAYKPLLLEYLETLFWSPVYAIGLVSGGFSERVSLNMVDDWTRRDALEGRAGDASAALKTYPFSQTVLDAVGWWASSSSEYLKTKGTLIMAKFRQTDEISAEIPRDVDSAIEQLEKKPAKKSIKDEFERIAEQDFLDTEKGDGHVWAVIELDRVAHLNGASLTLHTKWSGLRYWMHRYRILLFIVGPAFLWAVECAGALLAGYLVVTLFGGSSPNELPPPLSQQYARPARLERPPQRHTSGGSITGSSTRTHRNGGAGTSRQPTRVRRPRSAVTATPAAPAPVPESEVSSAPLVSTSDAPPDVPEPNAAPDHVSEPELQTPVVAPTTPPGPAPETAPISDSPSLEMPPLTPVNEPASRGESVTSVSSSTTALSGDVEEDASEAETEHDPEIGPEGELAPEHELQVGPEGELEPEHELQVEPAGELGPGPEAGAETESDAAIQEEAVSTPQSPAFDSSSIISMLPNTSRAPPTSVTPAMARGITSVGPSPVASLRVRTFDSVSPSPARPQLSGGARDEGESKDEEGSSGDADVSVASRSADEVSQDETAVASGPSSRVASKQPEELANLFAK